MLARLGRELGDGVAELVHEAVGDGLVHERALSLLRRDRRLVALLQRSGYGGLGKVARLVQQGLLCTSSYSGWDAPREALGLAGRGSPANRSRRHCVTARLVVRHCCHASEILEGLSRAEGGHFCVHTDLIDQLEPHVWFC